MKFSDLNLQDEIQQGINKVGFIECTPVQEQTFKQTLQTFDVCVQSQTGTGKTAAFLISIFQILLTVDKFKDKKAMIIVPTRELAVQIEKEANQLGEFTGLKIGSFFGGVGYRLQEDILQEGCDVLIGTPGRILDFSQQKKINLKEIGMLIIDEADRLFDMGFYPDIKRLFKSIPPVEERISMLFSATLSYRARQVAWDFMNDPIEIEIEPEQITVEKIQQVLYHVGKHEKISLLLGLISKYNPETLIIFTNTKHAALEVNKRLEINKVKSQLISGDLPQKKRLKVIENMKAGKIGYLIATDVAARGLHIDDLAMVINYDLPLNTENYVHRIGRTARLGKNGIAITLACEDYIYGLEAIEELIQQKIPVEYAEEELYMIDLSEGYSVNRSRNSKKNGTKAPSKKKNRRNESEQLKQNEKTLNKTRDHSSKNKNLKKTAPQKTKIKVDSSMPLASRIELYEKKYDSPLEFVAVHKIKEIRKKKKASFWFKLLKKIGL